ncbi:DUF6129 family protein [Vibrio algarum]|uniref:DUF6129 family protein n=1 Tax=Vibrio algarum TaxID=3020714 RepID=A0ABT4YRI2_9VIBR|nr:DUF6129 family protein [Vibrio sp. KJ40-1]MDB1124162.1 DUF6129 family protein [Vibrio sp. KJ40-1]
MESVLAIAVEDSEIKQLGFLIENLDTIDDLALRKVRTSYPHLKFTLCSEDDIGEREPYYRFATFDLHLVCVSKGSCSHLTHNISSCNGVVIALHEE